MQNSNFLKYMSTAPVILAIWISFTAGFIIEANRFYPDALTFPSTSANLISKNNIDQNLNDPSVKLSKEEVFKEAGLK